MRTITIDIINEEAIHLLKDMELLKLIRLRQVDIGHKDWSKYKGAMSKQPIEEVDQQLKEIRSECG
ncbi:MAG: hypothetical protein JJU28_19005 [Cyclobacteriaceae bacterium]|nr:hypothetical protein [Cyclobacteriaceae bacterium]